MPPPNADDPLRTANLSPAPDTNTDASGVTIDPLAPHVEDRPSTATGAADAFDPREPARDGLGGAAPASHHLPAIPGYEILGVLGRGEMGIVYKARHLALKRTVALKVILAGGHAGEPERARFRAEAEVIARLEHPGIVQIHEVGEHGGLPFCRLEFVGGGSLAQKLNGAPLPPVDAARLVEAVARAMHLAHSRNVVHRDLKPANVLLTPDGTPKVTDFGLARQLDSGSSRTQDGAVMGTPSYMAPEQASGRTHEAGTAADVYALGAILYECVTGRPPFRGRTVVETLDMVRNREAVPPSRLQPKLPRDLETVCLKCLRKEPENRYASAEGLAEDLRRFQSGVPIQARPTGALERGVKWLRRNPLPGALLGISGAAALLLVVGTAHFTARLAEERDEADRHAKTVARQRDALELVRRETTTHLYRALVRETRAVRTAREPGFRLAAWNAIERARSLETPELDLKELRHEAVACLGDFVGLRPLDLSDFPSPIRCAAIDAQTGTLAVGLADGSIDLRDTTAGRPIGRLKDGQAPVAHLIFRPDGTLQGIDARGTVSTWGKGEKSDSCQLRSVLAATPPGTLVAVSPGQAFLARAESEGVAIRDSVRNEVVVTVQRLRHTSGAVVSDDGRVVAGLTEDPVLSVGVWGRDNGEIQHRAGLNVGAFCSMSVSPDGSLLACGGDTALQLFDTNGLRQRIYIPSNAVLKMCFSPDNRFLAYATSAQNILLYSVASNRHVASLPYPSLQAGDEVTPVGIWFSPGGELLSCSRGRSVRTWDLRGTGERLALAGHDSGVPGIAFGPGRLLASCSKDGRVLLWDTAASRLKQTLHRFPVPMQSVAFSPDGKILAAVGESELSLWDVATGGRLAARDHGNSRLSGLAFSPDGRTLAASGTGVFVWRIRDTEAREGGIPNVALEQIASWTTHNAHCLSFSHDGRLLAWVDGNFTARVWDADSGEQLPFGGALILGYQSLAFTGAEGRLVFVSRGGAAEVWDVRRAERVFSLPVPRKIQDPHMAVSPGGRWLAAHLTSEQIGVWDLRTRELVLTMLPERAPVWSLTWSADERQLALGLSDGGLTVWDLDRVQGQLKSLGLEWPE